MTRAEVTGSESPPTPLMVRLYISDTGEAKEWAMEGVTTLGHWLETVDGPNVGAEEFWQVDSLPLALNLVPDLHEAIARARLRSETVEVRVSTVPVRRFASGQSPADDDASDDRLGAYEDA